MQKLVKVVRHNMKKIPKNNSKKIQKYKKKAGGARRATESSFSCPG